MIDETKLNKLCKPIIQKRGCKWILDEDTYKDDTDGNDDNNTIKYIHIKI